MTQNTYELVFYGNLAEGFSEAETKKHVAQLFKTTVDQVERMFTGKRVVIRNKLDQDTALKYILAMKKRGAECQIEAMGSPGVKVDLSQQAEQAKVQASVPPAETRSTEAQASEALTSQNTPATSSKTAPPVASSASQEPANLSGLPIAGEKVDEILSATHFALDPTGVRLTDEKPEVHAELHALDSVTLAPVGSDLVDEKDELPIAIPDISHLSLEP